MKSQDLSEFFNLLGQAKKEKEEEFDNLLKEANVDLDSLVSSTFDGIKKAEVEVTKNKKKEEKLIEQLDDVLEILDKPKVIIGVPEDFDVESLEEEDDYEELKKEIGSKKKPNKPAVEKIKEDDDISDTISKAIKFIEDTQVKEELQDIGPNDPSVDSIKKEVKELRNILYKVLAHGPGSGETKLEFLDDVDRDSAKVDGKVLKYQSSSGKWIGGATSGIGTNENINTTGIITASSFVGPLTGTASTATASATAYGLTGNVGNFTAGNITGTFLGNATTATALETARTIGGVSFDGSANINLPGVNQSGNQNTSGTAANLSGNPSISVTNITASGNVTVGGTLTYEDVTNVDSVGLITARSGIKVGSGITLSPDGDIYAIGVTTVTGNLVVGGDLDVTGDISYDEVTGRNLDISGVSTSAKSHVGVDTGVYGEELVVTGDARVTGILTIGTGSIVLDPTAKQLRGLEEIVIGIANTITIKQDTKGEIEFTDAGGTPKSVGIGSTVSINTSGIITATNFQGNLSGNLTMMDAAVLSGVSTTTTTNETTIDNFAAATYRSAKYLLQVTQGSSYQSSEILIVHDGTNSYGTEYAILKTTPNTLATFDTSIDDGNVLLKATPSSSSSTVFKIVRTSVEV
tara:strand:+ start:7 stop:1911 length:1905 start_codon:yes stop_codon:yes gene_type:complete